jgi:hypothetical protein
MSGCASPNQPSVSVAAAQPLGPAAGAQISYYSQPVMIHLDAAAATGSTTTTTTVEVATDAAFTDTVQTEGTVASPNGQLTAVLDHLSAATTYYWRARTTAGNNPPAFSRVATFTIGPQLVIEPPAPVQPLAGSFTHKRPMFTVANASRKGATTTLAYRFDVASDPGFSAFITTGTVAEGGTQTSFTPSVDFPSNATFYWRASASDPSTRVVSEYSVVQRFTTLNPDDGLYRYVLIVRLVVSTAVCTFGNGNPRPSPTNPIDISIDSGLSVSGDHWRLAVPGLSAGSVPDVQVEIDRAGIGASGSIEINRLQWSGASLPYQSMRASIASGSVDNATGGLEGRAHGLYGETNIPANFSCAADFVFTLTPHR